MGCRSLRYHDHLESLVRAMGSMGTTVFLQLRSGESLMAVDGESLIRLVIPLILLVIVVSHLSPIDDVDELYGM